MSIHLRRPKYRPTPPCAGAVTNGICNGRCTAYVSARIHIYVICTFHARLRFLIIRFAFSLRRPAGCVTAHAVAATQTKRMTGGPGPPCHDWLRSGYRLAVDTATCARRTENGSFRLCRDARRITDAAAVAVVPDCRGSR